MRRIIEVVCVEDAPNPDAAGASVAMSRRLAEQAGFTFEEAVPGVIVTKRRSVLIPWANIRGVVLVDVPDKATKQKPEARPQ